MGEQLQPGHRPAEEDDDADGLTNFEEYAFGLTPNSGSSVNPIVTQLNKATGQFSYTRRLLSKTGLIYTVRSSTTLATNDWTNLVKDTDYTESVSAVGDLETVTITLTPAPTADKLFIQVTAERPKRLNQGRAISESPPRMDSR